jgi:hypothetical protein
MRKRGINPGPFTRLIDATIIEMERDAANGRGNHRHPA